MHKNRGEKGFTLSEILTTIVLVGILASMILPRLTGQLDKARAAEAIQILRAIHQAQESYRNGPAGNYEQSGNWVKISLGDPNVPGSDFIYTFWDAVGIFDGKTYLAQAWNNVTNCDICINQNAVWSGSCLHVPLNPNNGACGNPPGYPGPCC